MDLQFFAPPGAVVATTTTLFQYTPSFKSLRNIAHGTGALAQDVYTKLYSISRRNPNTSVTSRTFPKTTNVLTTNITTNITTNPDTFQQSNVVLKDSDSISITSSAIDFDCISFEKFPFTPEPVRSSKIYGFDINGNKIEEESPPTLSYAFRNENVSEESILQKLTSYRINKNKTGDNMQVGQMEFLSKDPKSPTNTSEDGGCISFEKFLFTPEPVRSSKIYGCDINGSKIEEESPPTLSYAFRNENVSEESILQKLSSYRINKNKTGDNMQVGQMEFLSKGLKPPTNTSEDETMEEFCQNLSTHRTEWIQCDGKDTVSRIRRKIESGSYPNISVKDECKLPKLLRFVWKGKLKKLKSYLADEKKHKKINKQDEHGRTALHFAASWACKRTLEVLLQVPEAKVDIKDKHDMTPLFKAIEIQSLECVKLLVQSGANVHVTCRDGRNILEYAIMEYGDERIEIIDYLLSKVDVKRKQCGRLMNLLHKVCLTKKNVKVEKVIDLLVEHGENVNGVEGKGRSPLILAITMQRYDIVKCLLQHFADVRQIDDTYKSAMWYAKYNDCYQLLSDVCIGNICASNRKLIQVSTKVKRSNGLTGTKKVFDSYNVELSPKIYKKINN